MRVIAGRFRGRLLSSPDGKRTRPITDRVKETLFNILGTRFALPGHLPSFDVLDIFAGTGGLGIEALSRGARSCVFIERDRAALAALRGNINALRIHAACSVLSENAWTMRPPRVADGFGLVFLDPPYKDVSDTTRLADLLDRLSRALTEEGLIVLRYDIGLLRDFPGGLTPALEVIDRREIGHMGLMLFARKSLHSAPLDADASPPAV